jgi:hypothetical protein
MTHVHIVHYILSVSLRPQSLQVHCRQEILDVPANYVTRDCKKRKCTRCSQAALCSPCLLCFIYTGNSSQTWKQNKKSEKCAVISVPSLNMFPATCHTSLNSVVRYGTSNRSLLLRSQSRKRYDVPQTKAAFIHNVVPYIRTLEQNLQMAKEIERHLTVKSAFSADKNAHK